MSQEVSMVQVPSDSGYIDARYEGWVSYTPHDRWLPIWVKVEMAVQDNGASLRAKCCDEHCKSQWIPWRGILQGAVPLVTTERDHIQLCTRKEDDSLDSLESHGTVHLGSAYFECSQKEEDDEPCKNSYGRALTAGQKLAVLAIIAGLGGLVFYRAGGFPSRLARLLGR